MAVAGSLTYNTEIDKKGFEKGFESLKSVGSKAMKVLAGGIAGVSASMVALSKYSIDVGSSFEAGMSKVQAISEATDDELEKLTEKAKEMGAKTKFSATESSEAFQYMAMAGWKTGDMLEGIEGLMNLAAASGEDLASVSDIVTDALTAFGLKAKDSGHFADVLAKASSNSNTNVGMMGETFKYVAPLAGAMKYSIEDTAVAIGLMANAGIKSSQAGTALRSMFSRLVKPPKQAAEAMEALGISITNVDGTVKPLSQTMNELREKFSNLSEAEKTQYASSIAGQEAMSGMLAIVNASKEDYQKLVDSINNADGAAENMANTMNDNLSGAVTIMKSNIEGFGLAIYDRIKKPLTSTIKTITNIISKLTENLPLIIKKTIEIIKKVKDTIIDILPYIEAIGIAFLSWKVGTIIQNIVKGFQSAKLAISLYSMEINGANIAQGLFNGALTLGETLVGLLTGKITLAQIASAGLSKAQAALNAVMSANPIALVVLAIGTLIAIFVLLWNKCESFRNFWIGLWEHIKEFVSNAIEAIKSFFEKLPEWFKEKFQKAKEGIINVFQNVVSFFQEIYKSITDFFSNIGKWFLSKFQEAKQAIVTVFSTIAEWILINVIEPIKNFFAPLVEWFTELFTSIWDCIASIFEVIIELAKGCVETIKIVWEMIVEWFNEHIIQPIQEFFINFWESVKLAAQTAWDFIVSVWSIVSTWFNNYIIQPVKQFFIELWDGIKNAASNTWNGIREIWNIVSSWFNEHIISPITNFFSTMWNGLKTGASNAWQGIKNVFSSVTNWFKDVFTKAWEGVKNIFSTGGKIFSGIKEGIENTFKTVVNGIITGINKVISVPFKVINGALDKVREFGIGDAKPFSGLPTISVPQIPLLYRGGILKKGQVGLLEGNASEAVVPLEENKFWIKKVADEFRKQLNIGKNSTSTEASLQTYNNSSKTINNDNGVNINNTQNFYSKNSTPYEEQKQAKQQLRRLAYGL